jgi:glycosyltransferase involved in cell wall biosynthesis
MSERILVVSHAHPDFSLGGGELAAYNLFLAYRQHSGVAESTFLARAERGNAFPSGSITRRREGEYLWDQAMHDWHRLKALNTAGVVEAFAEFLQHINPTIVHAHHYAHMGVEYLRVIKQINPAIKVYLTLHEYMAICQNNGQMVKTGSSKLCTRESFDECHACFPHQSREDFWLRKRYIQRHFEAIDGFVAPSEFLRKRYIDWGIEPDRIVMIENGQTEFPSIAPRPLEEGGTRNRIGFFGQINPYKGIDLLLEALLQIPKASRKKLLVEIHGANLELQQETFRKRIDELRAQLIDQKVLRWVGPYQPDEVRQRMAKVDWVIVPSIWWENSPMVIQEAFTTGRPVIASNIGGMAEKVHNDVDGLHFAARNAVDLADVLMRAANEPGLWDRLVAGIQRPISYAQCADQHLAWFAAHRTMDKFGSMA